MAAKISNWPGTRSQRSNLSGALPPPFWKNLTFIFFLQRLPLKCLVVSILEPGLTKWRGRLCEELARTLLLVWFG